MSLLARAAAVLAAALLLAGCAPEKPEPSSSPPAADTPAAASPSPTPTAVVPETVDPADFLLEGAPGVLDADGFWKGHYGFFTDGTRSVRCDVWVFSGDSGGVTCGVTPGNQALVTYARPAADCDASRANPADGYSLGINYKVFAAGFAGFQGCGGATVDAALATVTKVLEDDQVLLVSHDNEQFTCTVAAGVASCSDAGSGASIRYGLAVAEFAG